jgi:hypothetical protein
MLLRLEVTRVESVDILRVRRRKTSGRLIE